MIHFRTFDLCHSYHPCFFPIRRVSFLSFLSLPGVPGGWGEMQATKNAFPQLLVSMPLRPLHFQAARATNRAASPCEEMRSAATLARPACSARLVAACCCKDQFLLRV